MPSYGQLKDPVEVVQGDRLELFLICYDSIWDADTKTWVRGDAVDLSDYQINGSVKASVDNPTVQTKWDCVKANQTSTRGGFWMILTPVKTSDFTASKYVFDVQIADNPDNVQTILRGDISVTKEISPNSDFVWTP